MGKKRFNVTVDRTICKACGICVAFCPMSVFTTDHDDKAVVSVPERCTGCRQCELLCPDFCITVVQVEETADG